jgi:ParB family chromosome partitioning protein
MTRRKGFFAQEPQAADEAARQREVAALLAPRRVVVQDLPIERIRPNPFQARRQFSDLEELAATIRTQGFTTRLRVRPDPATPGFFQLAFGERRLRAARLAGLTNVPCEIAEHTDEELLEIGLAENIQRRDLDPLEEAQAFRLFIAERGYSIRRLAERIGKDKSYVDDRLALLRQPADVQAMIAARPDSLRAAREIGRLETAAERAPLIAGVVGGTLNTEDVRAVVRAATTPVPTEGELPATAAARDPAPQPRPARQPGAGQRDTQARLKQDREILRTILARWREMAPTLAPAEQALLQDYLDELRAAEARVRAALPTGEP